jgi:hypothetical protein
MGRLENLATIFRFKYPVASQIVTKKGVENHGIRREKG